MLRMSPALLILQAAVPFCKILLERTCSETDIMYNMVDKFAIILNTIRRQVKNIRAKIMFNVFE